MGSRCGCEINSRIARAALGLLHLFGLLAVPIGCDVKRDVEIAERRDESVAKAISAIQNADLVMVYIGASDCEFARSDSAQQALREGLAHFEKAAEQSHQRILKIGIALDRVDTLGRLHLRSVGKFDHVFPQGTIDNAGQVHVASAYLGLPSVMPQLALLAFDPRTKGHSKPAPRVLFRAEGVHELLRWQSREWRIPSAGSTR